MLLRPYMLLKEPRGINQATTCNILIDTDFTVYDQRSLKKHDYAMTECNELTESGRQNWLVARWVEGEP